MEPLGRDARRLLQLAKGSHEPPLAAKARLRKGLEAKLAATAIVGTTGLLGNTTWAQAALPAAKSLLAAVPAAKSVLVSLVLVGAVSAGYVTAPTLRSLTIPAVLHRVGEPQPPTHTRKPRSAATQHSEPSRPALPSPQARDERAKHLADPITPTELANAHPGAASPPELTKPAVTASPTELTHTHPGAASPAELKNQRAVTNAPIELAGRRAALEQEQSLDLGTSAAMQFANPSTLTATPPALTNQVVVTTKPGGSHQEGRTQTNARRSSDPLAEETRLIRLAHQAILRGNPTAALAHLAEHQRSFASGALQKERDAAKIITLCKLSRMHEALALWAKFDSTWPDSALGARVRSSCHWDVEH